MYGNQSAIKKTKKLHHEAIKIRNLRYDPKKNKGLEKENPRQFRENLQSTLAP